MVATVQGYFVQNLVRLHKWSVQMDNFVGAPGVQIVVPTKFREMVLKVSHDGVAGHMGV